MYAQSIQELLIIISIAILINQDILAVRKMLLPNNNVVHVAALNNGD